MRSTRRRGSPSGFEQRLLRRLRRDLASSTSRPVVLGFSGGPDSLALALAVSKIQPLLGLDVHLIHVDHGLRPESADEARMAEALAGEVGLPFESMRIAADPKKVHPGVGVEEAVRRERYRAFADAAKRLGSDVVLLAHHERDQAESVLLHLLRGAGVHGASGMAVTSRITVPWWTDPCDSPTSIALIRPMLLEPKRSVDAYVAASGLTPVLDRSNESDAFRRNALRNDALPMLERISPGATSALARYGELAAHDDSLLDAIAAERLAEAAATTLVLPVADLRAMPPALARRVIRIWFSRNHPTLPLSFDRTDALLSLALRGEEGSAIEVGGEVRASVIGSDLVVGTETQIIDEAWRRFPGPQADIVPERMVEIKPGVPVQVGRLVLVLRAAGSDEPGFPLDGEAVRVRTVRAGDRFARSSVGVSDWLRRHRVPVLLRNRVLCLARDDGVVAVPGLPVPPPANRELGRTTWAVDWLYLEDERR